MLLCICAAYTTCVSNKCIYLISPFSLQIFCQSPDQPCSYSDKNYSQTCSNGQLYKTTTCLRWLKLSLPKSILIQLLLHNKMTTCLMQPAITFFVPQIKKNCLKQPLQNFIQLRNEKQCVKNKCLFDYIYYLQLNSLYCYIIMQSLFNVCKNWTFTFNIHLTNYCSD